MFRSSRLVLGAAMFALALGLGGCAGADGAPGIPGPAGERGTDGKDGVDGQKGADGADGQNGTNGADGIDGANMPGSKTVTAFEQNSMQIGSTATTALSATVSAPAKGKIIAISNMDAFCYAGQCATSGQTQGSYWMSNRDDGALVSGHAFEYFWLAPEETENTSRTAVFDVAAAGDVTIKLQASASNGAFGVYRRSLTLVFLPE